MKKESVICVLFVMATLTSQASTIAHWDFNDPTLGAEDGVAMPSSSGRKVWRKAATDKSGNGNHLATWEYSYAGFDWSANTVAGTGFSIKNAGALPTAFSWSDKSVPRGMDLESLASAAFTIEVRFNADVVGDGWSALVGRDGQGLVSDSTPGSQEYDFPALALNISPDGAVCFRYVDAAGVNHFTGSGPRIVMAKKWYHLAAVSDGTKLTLYLDGSVVGSLGMAGSSTNTALNNVRKGVAGGVDWEAGTWTVARGMYGGGHTDRFFGYIDDVAISDAALDQGSFVLR